MAVSSFDLMSSRRRVLATPPSPTVHALHTRTQQQSKIVHNVQEKQSNVPGSCHGMFYCSEPSEQLLRYYDTVNDTRYSVTYLVRSLQVGGEWTWTVLASFV